MSNGFTLAAEIDQCKRAAGYAKVAMVGLESAAPATEPTQGLNTPDHSEAVPTWKTQIVVLLERNMRYPESAQAPDARETPKVSSK